VLPPASRKPVVRVRRAKTMHVAAKIGGGGVEEARDSDLACEG